MREVQLRYVMRAKSNERNTLMFRDVYTNQLLRRYKPRVNGYHRVTIGSRAVLATINDQHTDFKGRTSALLFTDVDEAKDWYLYQLKSRGKHIKFNVMWDGKLTHI